MLNMDGGIDANVPLDYIEFHVFQSKNRYEAFICLGNNCEVAASGSLEPLLFHSPQIKALYSEGSDGKIKLVSSDDVNSSRWFTKSTVLRFLQIISSPEVLDATTGLRNEISQLEEAHSFHLSLYGKGSQKAKGYKKDTTDSVSSDDSKNELLRAMYLRLTTLRGELSYALAKSAAITLSRDEIVNLEKFCSFFGATDLRKSFCNLVELGPENGIETDCGESSDSIEEEEERSLERSRPQIRSASPRRSASPMKRVQIGRSGSRRSTPLTIKSLHYVPKERLVSQNDEVEVEVESVSNNARRISVQDAISLFESKQRESSGFQKTNNSFSSSVNKSVVLRRWSSGGFKACRDTVLGSDNSNNSVQLTPPESKQEEHDLSTGHEVQPDESECHKSEENERQTASVEWSRQKEAELDQLLLLKMTETKSVKYTNNTSQDDNRKSLNGGGPGGKKDENLGRENGGKQQSVMDPTKRSHNVNSQKPKRKSSPISKPALSKTSSLPATRKSWQSSPSPRTTVMSSTAKTLNPEMATSGTRRKSQPASSASTALSSKKPVSQLNPKPLKATQIDKGKVVNNSVNRNKQQLELFTEKIPKAQNTTSSTDSTLLEKPSLLLYSKKVTKKSSVVVPIEPKPFLRKGSKGVSSISRTKLSSQPDESSKDSNVVILRKEVDLEPLNDHIVPESEFVRKSPEKSPDLEPPPCQVAIPEDKSFQKTEEVSSDNETIDELTISPSAWVDDKEEHGDQLELESSSSPVMPSPLRVRHSLSQMLLEEISEPDVNECGNAENPRTIMVLQKDAPPRGLKKLLIFARKSSTGLSQGEVDDDAEETKSFGKKSSENLLKIATHHGKSNGFAPKSFFSLSAFGGGSK